MRRFGATHNGTRLTTQFQNGCRVGVWGTTEGLKSGEYDACHIPVHRSEGKKRDRRIEQGQRNEWRRRKDMANSWRQCGLPKQVFMCALAARPEAAHGTRDRGRRRWNSDRR